MDCRFGNEGFLPVQKNTNYNIIFKVEVLKSIESKSLSLSQDCLTLTIPAISLIGRWQREYAKEGSAGLKPKSKGRPASMNFKRKQ